MDLLIEILKTKRPSFDASTYAWMDSLLARELPSYYDSHALKRDENNNWWLTICDNSGLTPTHCFASHYDTVHREFGLNAVNYAKRTGIVSTNSGKRGTPLGADDGAGMFIMFELIKSGMPGHYVFFADEESGGVGSSNFDVGVLGSVDLIMSLDRAGTDEVIIEQSVGQCASIECGSWLATQLNSANKLFEFDISRLGTFTDSANFAYTVPECINLSVGYYDQHTKYETLDTRFLLQLIDALKRIDFRACPIKRDPSSLYVNAGGQSLEDYVFENPELVADYLESIGVTIDEIESAVLNTNYKSLSYEYERDFEIHYIDQYFKD